MRHLLLLALAGCASGRPVVRWTSVGVGVNERIEIKSSGDGSYVSMINGVEQKNERVVLSRSQVAELNELFREKGACQLAHDPEYKPVPDEGQTTLELAFPDHTCKIGRWNLESEGGQPALELAFPDQPCKRVLWTLEWERGKAQWIAETMRSMRPLPLRPGR